MNTLKAYRIFCRDDDHGQVAVFATAAKYVRAQDSREDCDCEFIERRVRRAPEFDDLSPGPVKTEDYLQRGWYYLCVNCQVLLGVKNKPFIVDGYVCCDRKCAIKARVVVEFVEVTKDKPKGGA